MHFMYGMASAYTGERLNILQEFQTMLVAAKVKISQTNFLVLSIHWHDWIVLLDKLFEI